VCNLKAVLDCLGLGLPLKMSLRGARGGGGLFPNAATGYQSVSAAARHLAQHCRAAARIVKRAKVYSSD